jgi:DNA-binding transcriptional ArsR family regulator
VTEILAIARALADESRLRALVAVSGGELCLCQLIEILGLAPATVSRHMNLLQQAGLVERTRRGKWRFYRLASRSKSRAVRRAVDWALAEVGGDARLRSDARKIRVVRRQDLEVLSACYRS